MSFYGETRALPTLELKYPYPGYALFGDITCYSNAAASNITESVSLDFKVDGEGRVTGTWSYTRVVARTGQQSTDEGEMTGHFDNGRASGELQTCDSGG